MKTKGKQSLYKSVIGRNVLVPASEFGVDVPQMYYRARVTKRDPSHPGAVVVKFAEDGTLAWLPAENVLAWIQEADAMGLSDEIGSAAQIFAAEVLAGFGGSGRRAGAAADAARANSAPHAASCSTPQSTAQAQSLPPLAMSSSDVSESSVAALGCSMDEEECGEVLSSLKRTCPPAARGRQCSWRPG